MYYNLFEDLDFSGDQFDLTRYVLTSEIRLDLLLNLYDSSKVLDEIKSDLNKKPGNLLRGLNELIEKGLSFIGVPFASFIAECLSGLFAGILSAIVLMLFDHIKGSFEVRDNQLKLLLLERKSVFIGVARIAISSILAEKSLLETYSFFDDLDIEINKRKTSIKKSIDTKKTNKKEIEGQQNIQRENIGSFKKLLDDGNEF